MNVRGVRTLMLAVPLAGFVAASGMHPSAQQGASVRGRVEIGIPVSARRPSAAYSTRAVPQPVLAPVSELRHVVVFLKDAPPQRTTPTAVDIRQRDENFVPRVVAVPVGSEVGFPNDDPIYHNVFSLSRVKTFNLGRYPRGESKAVRVTKTGVVKVFCDIHSHMTATIMVFDHPWFAMVGDDGRFELTGVPAGERQITAWHERLGDFTVPVRLEAGRATEANFVLPVPAQ
ncbi:MAG TPA: carboxypeptidase regulatory-like domain-containing protein [Vicinamibacterales bacterium]|nr:carboxypeptidase regulatory-like domain-containing protein [Vicinamibacterales bacterium]